MHYLKKQYFFFVLSILTTLFPTYTTTTRVKKLKRKKYSLQQNINTIEQKNSAMHIGIKSIPLRMRNHNNIEPHNQSSYNNLTSNCTCSLNANHLFTPASNTKILTAISALEYLGHDYLFETTLSYDGTIDNKILHGSLYIKGAGDPSLNRTNLSDLIASLSSKNIDTITGTLYIDTTIFDQDFFPPGSLVDNIGYGWNAPVTGLSLDGKGLCAPGLSYGCLADDDKLKANFYDIHSLISDMLAENNISLVGTIEMKATPSNAQLLATHKSKPVSQLLQHMMKNSDNLYADCLFKKIGAHHTGLPGSWQNGGQALKNLFEKMKLDPKTVIIVDGSGKSRYNLISPAHIVAMLQWAYKQAYFSHFFNSFSITGTDGTLQKRMPELSGMIHGKTGTLQGVSALSGYATNLHNEIVAFSVLINGFTADSLYNPPCKSEVEDTFCYLVTGQSAEKSSHATA